MRKKFLTLMVMLLAISIMLVGCGGATNTNNGKTASETQTSTQSQSASQTETSFTKLPQKTKVVLMLDWTPNTNHTGIYVALDKGYFEKRNLDVEIIQPSNVWPEQAVAGGKAQFGISFQGSMTKYVVKEGAPLVAIAAIIQHDTSGFIWLNDSGIETPKDWENKKYGGWGGSSEKAMISYIMKKYDADPSTVQMIELGVFDQITGLVKKAYDFTWIFYGWEGVDAELRGLDFTFFDLREHYPELDHYSPIFITNKEYMKEHPDVVRAFVEAVSEGYTYAAQHPEESAEILLKHAPELKKELVEKSQKWLSPKYIWDGKCWGYMKKEVWDRYSDYMVEMGLISQKPADVSTLFTNEFLPCQK